MVELSPEFRRLLIYEAVRSGDQRGFYDCVLRECTHLRSGVVNNDKPKSGVF